MEAHEDVLGPIDLLVIGYPPGAPMRGDAVPILLDLVKRGIVRILDALIVRKEADGSFASYDPADVDADTAGDLSAFAGASTGLMSSDDVALVAERMEPSSAAVMLVYENHWAAPFAAAVRRNGGVLIADERIHVQDLIDALDAAGSAA
jgi:Family of unknown function (DUF6325)